MICTILVTVTMMISGPTKTNPQGRLKVIQYQYVDFSKAWSKSKSEALSMGASLERNATFPKTLGVDIQRVDDFPCDYEGDRYL